MINLDSILNTVKVSIGLAADYTPFDTQIILAINAALARLTQLGVGPQNGFYITGNTETWSQFIGSASNLEQVKQYVFLKTKMAFDPPQNSFLMDYFKSQTAEMEWLLNVTVDDWEGLNE